MDGVGPCDGCGKSLSDFLDICPACGHQRPEPVSRAPRVGPRPMAQKSAREAADGEGASTHGEEVEKPSRWRLPGRQQTPAQHVRVVDVQIPFDSLVSLLVKLVLAGIPAMIILGMIAAFLLWMLGGVRL